MRKFLIIGLAMLGRSRRPRLAQHEGGLMRYRFEAKRAVKGLFRSKESTILVASLLGAAVFAGAGLADVWSLSVSKDTNNIRMRVQHFSTSNFDSGWHTHPGVVIVQVEQGSLSYTGANCIKKTYAAGETFIEIPNTTARVVGVGYAKFTGTFMVGHGDPLTVPTAPVTCP
jgi:quercetin dioxygenase-like cupin family protein